MGEAAAEVEGVVGRQPPRSQRIWTFDWTEFVSSFTTFPTTETAARSMTCQLPDPTTSWEPGKLRAGRRFSSVSPLRLKRKRVAPTESCLRWDAALIGARSR